MVVMVIKDVMKCLQHKRECYQEIISNDPKLREILPSLRFTESGIYLAYDELSRTTCVLFTFLSCLTTLHLVEFAYNKSH